jgi:hypothetical protein
MVLAEDRQRGKVHGDTYWVGMMKPRSSFPLLNLPRLVDILSGWRVGACAACPAWVPSSARRTHDLRLLATAMGVTVASQSRR